MSVARHLFNFKTPIVCHLEHLDIVIEDKILLLLSWKFRHPYLVSIPSLRKKYRQRESTIILRVPSHIKVINISISSFWRRKKIKVILKKLKLDHGTSRLIIQQFKPLKMPYLTMFDVVIRKQPAVTKSPVPTLKNIKLRLSPREIHLKSDKLTYLQ